MPGRLVRSRTAVRSNRRRTAWSTLGIVPTIAAGASANFEITGDLATVAGSSTLGITILRTHLRIAVTSATVIGDAFTWGCLVDRAVSIGNPAPAGAPTGASVDIPWLWNEESVATPTYTMGGSNTIDVDIKAKRKCTQLNSAYLLCITNNAGLVKTMRIFARTLVALP